MTLVPAAPAATRSILETMAMLPSGTLPMNTETGQVLRISYDELGSYLKATLGGDAEKQRNTDHALRDQLYHDGGVKFMCGVIDKVFKDPDVQQKRKEWVPYARFTNPLKRIINKISTVYSRPAKRSVKNGDEAYQALLLELRFDEQMLQLSRLLNLHRALLVGYRHRLRPDGRLEPVMDIATPANVRALVHPYDDKLVIGWLVRTCFKPVRTNSDTPVWMLWTDHERVGIRDDMTVISSSYREHHLGVNPWVPVTLSPPQSGFWPGEEGQDLVAARIAVWMQGVLMLKESKSATKQTVITGDGTATARGQSADSETPTELSDGQAVQTIDMSMDLKMFEDASDHITHHAALDYGMSEAIVNNQGVQSAEARELMNEPLYELRDEQQIPLRQFERTYVNTMAAIGKVELPPERHFDPTEWELQYGSSKLKLDPTKEQDLFEKKRAAGITSTVKFMCESRPGLTPEAAQLELEENIEQETLRNELMRPMQAVSGSMGADMPAGSDTPLQPQASAATDAPVTPVPDDAAIASAPGATEDVQKSALNGAQILAVVELIKSVVNGAVPRDAGINTLRVALQISASEAESLLGPEGFVPKPSGSKGSPPNVLLDGGPPQDSAA